ncbi:hypothetical protein DY000_02050342 [Brassica cretica]|uniref:Uncharacterized protein n=1 Tax=Brassica cretica TaxID=69181 RepID=A0ABQ7EX10_BRACR|nr:hypothetical protein DY000_02050342 [Brassica cretica]
MKLFRKFITTLRDPKSPGEYDENAKFQLPVNSCLESSFQGQPVVEYDLGIVERPCSPIPLIVVPVSMPLGPPPSFSPYISKLSLLSTLKPCNL